MRTSGYFSHIFGRITALLLVLAAMLPSLALADLNEEQKLAPTANNGADAGQASAIFGDTAVVGAPGDTGDALGCVPGAGAAYVYTRSGLVWSKVATLCASDGTAGDQFGAGVSISKCGNNRGWRAGPWFQCWRRLRLQWQRCKLDGKWHDPFCQWYNRPRFRCFDPGIHDCSRCAAYPSR